MSSSYQSTGIIETELGTSYLSEDTKKILQSYYEWIDTKYGVSNINASWGTGERNNIYSGSNLEDFNLIVETYFSYNSLGGADSGNSSFNPILINWGVFCSSDITSATALPNPPITVWSSTVTNNSLHLAA